VNKALCASCVTANKNIADNNNHTFSQSYRRLFTDTFNDKDTLTNGDRPFLEEEVGRGRNLKK